MHTAEALAVGRPIVPVPGLGELDRSALGWVGERPCYPLIAAAGVVRACGNATH